MSAAKDHNASLDRQVTRDELITFLKLYEAIYMRTQTHPTMRQESEVVLQATFLLNRLAQSA